MKKETKRRLEKFDKDFKERLKWITSRKYEIPRSYAETVRTVRKMYIEFVDDIFKSQRTVISDHQKEIKELQYDIEHLENTTFYKKYIELKQQLTKKDKEIKRLRG